MKGKDPYPSMMRRLSCNPKRFWESWRQEVLKLKCDWRVSTKELVLRAQVRSSAGIHDVKVLVDTGAKIPLAFRKGLFAKEALKVAQFPVHFSVADGQPMEGGTHGAFLQLRLPVHTDQGLVLAKTARLFAYEANIRGMDVIVGYPFLKSFGLSVDTSNDSLCLRKKASSPRRGEVWMTPFQ